MKKRNWRKKWLIPAGLFVGITAVLLLILGRRETVPNSIAAKAAALLLTDQAAIDSVDTGPWLDEEQEASWYMSYFSWLYENGFFDPEITPAKKAGEALTYETFFHFLDQIGCRNLVSAPLGSLIPSMKVPEQLWWETYEKVMEERENHGIERKEFIVIGTPANIAQLEAWQAVTDQGLMDFDGLVLDPYIDCLVEGLVKDGQLICLTRLADSQVTYRNVWITGSSAETLQVFLYGYERSFPGSQLPDDLNGVVADLTVTGQQVSQVSLKRESIQAKVLSVGDGYIELEGYGKVPVAEDFRIYKVYGTLELQDSSAILTGYDIQQFVVADGVICAALTVRALEASNIRVLIRNSDYESIWHESLTITCADPFRISCDGWEQTFQGGEVIEIGRDHEWLSRGRLTVTCDSYAGELEVSSVTRSQGAPSYKGSLEITAGEGGILLVNELALEDYLCRVVPSEMPSGYPAEALRAQAVCARSYAYGQILANACREYGAHVDDSTLYQVYNNIEEQQTTTRAVQDTYGEIAVWQDQAIQAYYYSTSWGVSEDVGVWGTDTDSYGYLVSREISSDGGEGQADYSSEDAFRARIDAVFPSDYDSSYPWYRWRTSIGAEQLAEQLNQRLEQYRQQYPDQVTAEGSAASFEGPVVSVEVTGRLKGGTVNEMVITGENIILRLKGQQVIRNMLGSEEMVYRNQEGESAGRTGLPSAFFYVTAEEDGEGTVTFSLIGGGYGHGVGMSQNGAAGMAQRGKSYQEILAFFYEGASLEKLY